MQVESILFKTSFVIDGVETNCWHYRRTDLIYKAHNLGIKLSYWGVYRYKKRHLFEIDISKVKEKWRLPENFKEKGSFCVQRLYYHHSTGFTTFDKTKKSNQHQEP